MQFQIGMQNFFIKVGIKTVFSLVSALSALLCHVLCSHMIPVNKNGFYRLFVIMVRIKSHYSARAKTLCCEDQCTIV